MKRSNVRRTRRLAVACLATLALLFAAPATQADSDIECNGSLPPGVYEANIVVPPGRDCFLFGVTVHGNVKALADSQLNVYAQSTIYGNIEGDRADAINVGISTVHGNITATEGGPATRGALFNCDLEPPFDNPCEFQVVDTTVVNGSIQVTKMTGSVGLQSSHNIRKGNVQFVDNFIPADEILFIWSNLGIAGNLQVFKNTGPGKKFVFQNAVSGVIQCYENDPPFIGGPNFGRAPDQPPLFMTGKNQCLGTST